MKIRAYTINAFAKTKKGGNPAGVVLKADILSEADMKKIAGILGFSETAFVMKSDKADYKVRFFTPEEEVDLCGHATIGTYSAMYHKGFVRPGRYVQETKAGILPIEVKEDGTVMMNQRLPEFCEILPAEEIADSLQISASAIRKGMPIQVVTTGLRDIMIPVMSRDILMHIKPDFKQVTEISRKYNAVGYHIFALDTLQQANAHCRNLAPLYGIPEESATGTSNGALACYLWKQRAVSLENTDNMVFEQGYAMNLPSEIVVSLRADDKEVKEIKVGGKALNLCESVLAI